MLCPSAQFFEEGAFSVSLVSVGHCGVLSVGTIISIIVSSVCRNSRYWSVSVIRLVIIAIMNICSLTSAVRLSTTASHPWPTECSQIRLRLTRSFARRQVGLNWEGSIICVLLFGWASPNKIILEFIFRPSLLFIVTSWWRAIFACTSSVFGRSVCWSVVVCSGSWMVLSSQVGSAWADYILSDKDLQVWKSKRGQTNELILVFENLHPELRVRARQ